MFPISHHQLPDGRGSEMHKPSTLNQASATTVTVDYTTMNGTATAGSDYTAAAGTLTFAPGETSKTFTVAITDDSAAEGDETVGVMLANANGATLSGPTTAPLTIHDDDGKFSFSAAASSAGEAAGVAYLTIQRNTTAGSAAVTVARVGGSATAGSDFNTFSSMVANFADGQSQVILPVQIAEDSLAEGDETVLFALSSPSSGYGLDPNLSSAVLTITDNDTNHAPQISDQSFTLAENSAAETMVGLVAASDSDAGQSLRYAITSGNTNGAFAIDSVTGVLRVANGAALDFETNPTFDLTVQVTDSITPALSSSAQVSIALTNVNDPPALVVPGSQAVVEDDYTVINGISVQDQDAGSAPVQVTLAVGHGVLYVDEVAENGLTAADISGNGEASVTLTGSIAAINATLASGVLYLPASDDNGADTLSIICDDEGNSGSANVSISVGAVNDAPAAFDTFATTDPDTPATVDVTADIWDADGDALSVTSVTLPGHGSVTWQGGTITYTPEEGFTGTDWFTYTATDGHGGTTIGKVFFSVTANAVEPGERLSQLNDLAHQADEAGVRIFGDGMQNGSGEYAGFQTWLATLSTQLNLVQTDINNFTTVSAQQFQAHVRSFSNAITNVSQRVTEIIRLSEIIRGTEAEALPLTQGDAFRIKGIRRDLTEVYNVLDAMVSAMNELQTRLQNAINSAQGRFGGPAIQTLNTAMENLSNYVTDCSDERRDVDTLRATDGPEADEVVEAMNTLSSGIDAAIGVANTIWEGDFSQANDDLTNAARELLRRESLGDPEQFGNYLETYNTALMNLHGELARILDSLQTATDKADDAWEDAQQDDFRLKGIASDFLRIDGILGRLEPAILDQGTALQVIYEATAESSNLRLYLPNLQTGLDNLTADYQLLLAFQAYVDPYARIEASA